MKFDDYTIAEALVLKKMGVHISRIPHPDGQLTNKHLADIGHDYTYIVPLGVDCKDKLMNGQFLARS